MAYTGIESIKKAYANQLTESGDYSKALQVANKNYITPIFTEGEIHAEEVPKLSRLNGFLNDICVDFAALEKETQSLAEKYDALAKGVALRLSAVDEKLFRVEERMKDLNIICGNYKDFAKVISLKATELGGNFAYFDDYTLSLYGRTYQVAADIYEITGNGYEGNLHVVDNENNFVNDSLDTGNRNYLNDNSIVTAYEYSRITADATEKNYPAEINFDNVEAVCGIVLRSNEMFTALNISSDIDTIILKDVLISLDGGATYKSVLSKKSLAINNPDEKYSNDQYVYHSGMISFEATNYVKLVFQSNGTTSENLMYRKTTTNPETSKTETSIYRLETAKRHLIRINNIQLLRGSYQTSCRIYTGNLISTPVKSIAIFANEFVPNFFPDNKNYIKYTLTVNGEDYDIVPINSDKQGAKIIKFLNTVSTDSYVTHIDESIKAAKLTITMRTPNAIYTPFLSNLKICLGETVGG